MPEQGQMGDYFIADEPVPAFWVQEPYSLHGSRREQEARWRVVRAARRWLDARQAVRDAARSSSGGRTGTVEE